MTTSREIRRLRPIKADKPSAAPNPEKYAMSGTEDGEQIALFMWASQNYETYPELRWMFAIPNGGFRHKAEAGRLKAMGVKRGVSDIFLPIKRGEFSGLFIELKRKATATKRAGQTSDEQKEFIDFVKTQGYGGCICIGYDAAKEVIIHYLEWS